MSTDKSRKRPRTPPAVTNVNVVPTTAPAALSWELIINDRMVKKLRVACDPTDTIETLKKSIAVQLGGSVKPDKLRLQRANAVLRNHICLEDYEITNGTHW